MPKRKDVIALVVICVIAVIAFVVIGVALSSCSVARVAQPTAVYGTISPDEYAEAEDHFAGGQVEPKPIVLYWNDERCQELLDKRDGFAIASASTGVLTGAGGLATALPEDASRSERLGFGLATLGLSAIGAGFGLAARSLSERFERYCRTEDPKPFEHPASDEELPIDAGTDR